MDRKNFLQSTIPFLATAGLLSDDQYTDILSRKIPPYLKSGDTIGITCPSGHLSWEEAQPCIQKMEEWGFKVVSGKTIGARDFTFAGTDAERAAEFQEMMNDDQIDAIMPGRGGYGAVRIIDKLDFSKFIKKPKWIIGFSDATVFHLHLNCRLGIPSIHSKMCNSFPEDPTSATLAQADAIDSIRRSLLGEKMVYFAPTMEQNREGVAEGKLIGGNLSIIQMLCGSKSQVKTDGAILFVEDVGEYLYKLDGMFWNLLRSGKLHKLKGLVIGAFRIKEDDPGEEFGKSLYEIVMEKVDQFSYPVCFDFPVGHVRVNYALKCGVTHRLEVSTDNAQLTALQ